MLKILKKSKIFLILMIFINVSSLIASELHNFPTVQSQSPFGNKGDIIKQLYNEDGLLVYDSVLKLIEDIENGNLDDVCTDEEWQKINYFIASLAKHGMMPNTTDEEKTEIERDIQELLNPVEKDFRFENSSYTNDNYQITHAIYYGQSNTVHCKSWFKKQYNHTKKFVKKHKTAVIVATVIVVAVAAVAITIAVIPSTAAVATAVTTGAAATKAASDSSNPNSNNKTTPSNDTSIKPPNNPGDNINKPTLTQSIDNQINDIKNAIVENNLLPSNQNFPSTEYDRIIGSTLAHEALSNASQNLFTETYEQKIIQGHVKIDNAFSTELTSSYLDKKNLLSNSPKELQEKIYYFQGQEALKTHYYDQAIDSFGKAIEVNPNNHNVYLDRAFAYLQAGEFDKSLDDYHVYSEQQSKSLEKLTTFIDCVDFSLGVRTGITKGTIASGKELLLFAVDVLQNPVSTGKGLYKVVDNFEKDLAILISDYMLRPIDVIKEIYQQITDPGEWRQLRDAFIPEIGDLFENWETLSAKENGEKLGYILGKFGGNIAIPGVAAKAISKGVKGAKDLAVIAKNLQKIEKVIELEALSASGGSSGVFVKTTSELNITKYSQTGLKKSKLISSSEEILKKQRNCELFQKFKKAENFLKPYRNKYLPENTVRELIRQAGINTYPRPKGIPQNYRVKISKTGGGIKYVHPKDEGTYIRIMPGKPHSPNPCQQKPYATQLKNGKILDKLGNFVEKNSVESHIPLKEFIYRSN